MDQILGALGDLTNTELHNLALAVQTTIAERTSPVPRLEPTVEWGLLQLLAEVVMADGESHPNEDEAATNYILDHLAVSESDANRLLALYQEAKHEETPQEHGFANLSNEDRDALFDACCRVAWADLALDGRERTALDRISVLLKIPPEEAVQKIDAYGKAVAERASRQVVYTHVATVQVKAEPEPVQASAEWMERAIQLLAIDLLSQRKAAKVSAADSSWLRQVPGAEGPIVGQALSRCALLTGSGESYTWKSGTATERQRARIEATLFKSLLSQGAPLTTRFLTYRVSPGKLVPEWELTRIAESSPALVHYRAGNGKWLGAAQWGVEGALMVIEGDWSLIRRDLKKMIGKPGPDDSLRPEEWQAVLEFSRQRKDGEIEELAHQKLAVAMIA